MARYGSVRLGTVRYGTVGTVLSRSKPLTLMIMYLFSSTDVSHTAPTSPGLPEIIAGDHTAPAVPVPDVPVVLARRSTRAAAARPRYSMFFSGKNFAHFTPPPFRSGRFSR